MKKNIKQGDFIYEAVYPHIHRYEIEQIIEQDNELYVKVLVGYYKDKEKLILLDSQNTDISLIKLKGKVLDKVQRMFERKFKSRK